MFITYTHNIHITYVHSFNLLSTLPSSYDDIAIPQFHDSRQIKCQLLALLFPHRAFATPAAAVTAAGPLTKPFQFRFNLIQKVQGTSYVTWLRTREAKIFASWLSLFLKALPTMQLSERKITLTVINVKILTSSNTALRTMKLYFENCKYQDFLAQDIILHVMWRGTVL